MLGKDGSTNDTATLNFYYAGNASSSNRFEVGFWGADSLLNVLADGNVGIGTTSPSTKLDVNGTVTATDLQSDTATIATIPFFTSGSQAIIDKNGALNIRGNWIRFQKPGTATDMIVAKPDGEVELYHNGNKKLETTASGVNVVGTVSATSFDGDLTTAFGYISIDANSGNVLLSGDTGDMTFTNTGTGIFSFGGTVTATAFEGDGSALTDIDAAKGGGTDHTFIETDNSVNTSYTLSTNRNAMTVGPVTINSGATVTVPSGQRWVIL